MLHECDPKSIGKCSGCGALACAECVDDHMDACVPRLWHERMDPYGLDPDGWMRCDCPYVTLDVKILSRTGPR